MFENHSFQFRGQPQSLSELEIRSERLLLKPIEPRFAEDVFREFTPTITRFMFPRPADSIEETLEFVRSSQAGAARGTDLIFAVLLNESEEFMGCCGIHFRRNPSTPELGIWIKASGHGSGYGREAVHALKEWADKTFVCEYFIYPVDRQNQPSRKIAESLGGVVADELQSTTMSGTTLDELVYHIPSRVTG